MVKKILTKLIWIISATVVISVLILTFYSKSSRAVERSDLEARIIKFSESQDLEINLTKLFPWEWEYLCVTGTYAGMDSFERTMGRSLTLADKLKWVWYGSSGEHEVNFIFEGKDRVVEDIYPYFSYSYLNLDQGLLSRGRCVERSDLLVLKKDVGAMIITLEEKMGSESILKE